MSKPRIKRKVWFGHGTAALAIAVDRFLPMLPDVVGVCVGFGAVVLYAFGVWDWSRQFQAIAQQNRNRRTRNLRLALTGLTAICGVLTLILLVRLVPIGESNSQRLVDDQRNEIERLRRLVEGTAPLEATALTGLSNRELRTRATNASNGIKELNEHYRQEQEALRGRRGRSEVNAVEFQKLEEAQRASLASEFERDHRVDARMALGELRNRIPLSARKHLIGVPTFTEVGPSPRNAGSISVYDMPLPPTFALPMSELLARELEELAKLLPD